MEGRRSTSTRVPSSDAPEGHVDRWVAIGALLVLTMFITATSAMTGAQMVHYWCTIGPCG